MKKMFTLNSKSRSRWMLLLLLLVAGVTNTLAQNVTISPTTGKLVAGLTEDTQGTHETGFENGWSSLWQHEQLSLTLTVSDYSTLTEGDVLKRPAGNISVFKKNNTLGEKLVIQGGEASDCYIAVALPKGYRFTGYRGVLLNNLNHMTVNNSPIGKYNPLNGRPRDVDISKAFYETHKNYDQSNRLAIAVDNNGSATMGGAKSDNSDTKEYVIERQADDMGNILYFKIVHQTDGGYAITIKSFEFFFTAEGDFTETVAPKETNNTGVSWARSSFKTSKLDLGPIKPNDKGDATFYSYDYNNVTDLDAYIDLYEYDAVSNGKPANVGAKKGIYAIEEDGKMYYGLKNNTYFVETPLELTTQDNNTLYQGYRIVGAKINYAPVPSMKGTEHHTETKTYPTFTISGTVETWTWESGFLGLGGQWSRNGETTYYLTSSAGVTSTASQRAIWFMDDDGYIRLASDPTKYLKNQRVGGTNNRLSVVGLGDRPPKFAVNGDGQITIQNSNMYMCFNPETESHFGNGTRIVGVDYFYLNNGGTDYIATRALTGNTTDVTREWDEEVDLGSSSYTLRVYDKTGKEDEIDEATGEVKVQHVTEIPVSPTTAANFIELNDLNNDAIKFAIADLDEETEGTDFKAPITIELTMEALNPYINSLKIVCQEVSGNGRKISQTFTASDFSVRGGKFNFYVPDEFEQPVQFTFEELKSNYGDNTYWGKEDSKHNSRYSLVKSPYWSSATDLYATSYDPDHAYTDKVYVDVAGKEKFRFNNADELDNQSTSTETKYLEEYPFSLAAYGGDSKFGDVKLSIGQETTAYLFTCDETRYNIAPTTATQHRHYAFYVMDITLQKNTYTPVFAWTKVYNKTCYHDGKEERQDAMYGLELQTTAASDEGEFGYLSVKQVLDGIDKQITDKVAGAPATKDQILYIDGSKLQNIVETSLTNVQTGEVTNYTLNQLQPGLAKNALIFLPGGASSNYNNFVEKTATGGFQASNDILLTDKQPFFSPYDVSILDTKFVKYTREITTAQNGQVTSATVVLPFTINIDKESGKYNDGAGNVFTLHELGGENVLSESPTRDYDYIHVLPLGGVTTTYANKPYIIKVEQVTAPEGTTASFVVNQTASTIWATKKSYAVDYLPGSYEFVGAEGTGTSQQNGKDLSNTTFVTKGSFAGQFMDKSERQVFYFAKNMFLSIKKLDTQSLYVYPFRAYFDYAGSEDPKAKKLSLFFGENTNPTGINAVENEPIAVDPNAPVYDMLGRKIADSVREIAGKKLPRGIYVVNGVKFNVK